MVLSGLVTAWRLAGWPMRRSPSLVKATTDGVVRAPSAFSITLGLPPSITATQLLVVPRSIPITFAIVYPLLAPRGRAAQRPAKFDFEGDIGVRKRPARAGRNRQKTGFVEKKKRCGPRASPSRR